MEKQITKLVSILLKLTYTETCTILKGGSIFTDIALPNDHKYCEEGDEDSRYQVVIKIDEESIKHLEFMRVYLQKKEESIGGSVHMTQGNFK